MLTVQELCKLFFQLITFSVQISGSGGSVILLGHNVTLTAKSTPPSLLNEWSMCNAANVVISGRFPLLQVLPPSSLMTSPQWNDLCMAYVSTLCQLVFCYVVESGLADVIRLLCDGDADIKCLSPSPDLLRAYDDIQLLESDICYVLNWTSVENLLMQHVRKMSGELSYKLPKHCQVFANLNVTVLAESFKSWSMPCHYGPPKASIPFSFRFSITVPLPFRFALNNVSVALFVCHGDA